MNLGIGGMGGLQAGKGHRNLQLGTTMMKMIVLDIEEEGGQVIIRDRGAKSAKGTYLVVRVAQNMIHHPRSDTEPTVVGVLHHQGKLLKMKVYIDRMMTQGLHTDAEAEGIVTNDLVLPAVLLPLKRGGNDAALRNMHWTIFVTSLSHRDRIRQT